MLLIAMHRHGVRDCVKSYDFEALMQRLGHAAVIVDLFEVRHSSSASVVRNGLGSSKGANYILYNSARLETLLRTFAAQVNEGVYEPLPPLEKIDFTLLEDEVRLITNLIAFTFICYSLFVVGLATDLWIFVDIPRDVGVNSGAAKAGTVWSTSTRALYSGFGQSLQSLLSQQTDFGANTFEFDARALCPHLFG